MDLRPISDALGVEVLGLNASVSLAPADAHRLREAFDQHHLLLLRDQDIDPAGQERFVATFGPLVDDLGDGERSGAISNVGDEGGGSGPLPFHCDLSFTRSPVRAIALFAEVVPEAGTSTWFANATRAWTTLPAELRDQASGRDVRHTLPLASNMREARAREVDLSDTDPYFDHPIPLRHPRTDRDVLFVTDLHSSEIVGLDSPSSRRLLDALITHITASPHVYEHHWRAGDLMVWDNIALQHARSDVSAVGPRTFRRNAINDERIIELLPELIAMGR